MLEFLPSFLQPLGLAKLTILVLIGLYVMFSIVLFTQIQTMNSIFSHTAGKAFFLFLSMIAVIAGISLFILSVAIL